MYTLAEILKAINSRQHPVQLVKHYDEISDSARKNMQWPAIAEVKYDGVYAIIVMTSDKGVQFISRSGKPLYFEQNYLPDLFKCSAFMQALLEGYCFVSELINPELSLEELSGMVNPNRVTGWDNTSMLTADFVVHDSVTVGNLHDGFSALEFVQRREFLKCVPAQNTPISGLVHKESEWASFATTAITGSAEGAVLKQLHAPWIAGHKGWHVTKEVRGVHLDLRCVGWALGKGKRSNQIGVLYFEYNGKLFSADLGKGWTDEKRDALTARAQSLNDDVTGALFHIKGLQISSKGVVRLPKVQEERIDKHVADGE